MKILMVTRGYPQKHNNMLGVFEKDQALALKNAGHDVVYAVVDIRSIRRKRKFGINHFFDENGLEIFEMNWPLGPMPRFLIEYFRQQALIKLYSYILKKNGKPDIVHAHFLNYGVISVKLCERERLPLVITEHSSYLNASILPAKIVKRAKKAYSACAAIIAVSESLALSIKEKIGFESIVINNIAQVDIKELENIDKKTDDFVFSTAGLLIKRKGFDLLFNALEKVVKVYPNVKLMVYGDGPERNNLLKQVEKLCIGEHVRFYGRYDKADVGELLGKSDCFVLASRQETFGVVYIEAMATGIPVIATVCGGPENFVTEDVGILIDKDDEEQLVKAMQRMITEYNRFDSEHISKFVQMNFSPSVIAQQISDVYKLVMETRNN